MGKAEPAGQSSIPPRIHIWGWFQPPPQVTHGPHLTLISASEPSWEGQLPASPSRRGALGGPPSQPQFPPQGPGRGTRTMWESSGSEASSSELGLPCTAGAAWGAGRGLSQKPQPQSPTGCTPASDNPPPQPEPKGQEEGTGQMALALRRLKLWRILRPIRPRRPQKKRSGSPSLRQALTQRGGGGWVEGAQEAGTRDQGPMAIPGRLPSTPAQAGPCSALTNAALFLRQDAQGALGAGPWEALPKPPILPRERRLCLPPSNPALPAPPSPLCGKEAAGAGVAAGASCPCDRVIVPSREFGAMWERH